MEKFVLLTQLIFCSILSFGQRIKIPVENYHGRFEFVVESSLQISLFTGDSIYLDRVLYSIPSHHPRILPIPPDFVSVSYVVIQIIPEGDVLYLISRRGCDNKLYISSYVYCIKTKEWEIVSDLAKVDVMERYKDTPP